MRPSPGSGAAALAALGMLPVSARRFRNTAFRLSVMGARRIRPVTGSRLATFARLGFETTGTWPLDGGLATGVSARVSGDLVRLSAPSLAPPRGARQAPICPVGGPLDLPPPPKSPARAPR